MICIVFGILGCVGNFGVWDVYSYFVGYVNEVFEGIVLSMYFVMILNGELGLGLVVGVVVGGVFGFEVGGGRVENIVVVVGGVIIGGLIGVVVENVVIMIEGVEYVIWIVDDRKILVV